MALTDRGDSYRVDGMLTSRQIETAVSLNHRRGLVLVRIYELKTNRACPIFDHDFISC